MITFVITEILVAAMAIMRSLIVGAVIAGYLAGPAYAQKQQQPEKTGPQLEEEQKKKDAEAIDRQYKATLDRTKGSLPESRPIDPWQNMRGSDDSKTKR